MEETPSTERKVKCTRCLQRKGIHSARFHHTIGLVLMYSEHIKVYDVSSFVSQHPGGVEQILAGAGRDITQVFNSYHKPNTFER